MNKPNGKSSQCYHCLHPSDAIALEANKLDEFGAAAGISSITVRRAWRKSNGTYEDGPVKIIISGRPAAVDDTVRKINDWLGFYAIGYYW